MNDTTTTESTATPTSLHPLHDRIVVKRKDAEEKIGSLYVPDNAKEKPSRGTVIAVGEGKRDDLGRRIVPDVQAGDEVVFGKYAGTELKVEGEMHVVLREEDVLSIVRGEELHPLHDRVVVRRKAAEQTSLGGIIIPDTAKEKPVRGTVIAVGEGKRDDLGKRITPDVKVGDEVFFGKYAGTEVKLAEELSVVREDEILAIVRGDG